MIYYKLIVNYSLDDETRDIEYNAITFNAEYGAQQESSNFNVMVKRDNNTDYLETIVSNPTLSINKITVYKDEEIVYEDTIWNKLARIYIIGDSTGELSKNLQFIIGE